MVAQSAGNKIRSNIEEELALATEPKNIPK